MPVATSLRCAVLGLLLSGCSETIEREPRPVPVPAPAPWHTARSLIAEADRAELWEHGVLIDLGAPDQQKYIRGGWRTGWGRSRADRDGVTSAEVNGRAFLELHDWSGGIRFVRLRARPLSPRQRLEVLLDNVKLGSRDLPSRWSEVELQLSSRSRPGRRWIELRFDPAGTPAALVDWVWLATERAPTPRAGRVGVRSFGEPRRALVAPRSRAYAYYLEVPPRAQLVFDYAARGPAELVVRVTDDESPAVDALRVDLRAARQLFVARPAAAPWRRARVDLAGLAGRMVRLELAARTGERGEAAWGEPAIVVPGPARGVPPVLPGQPARSAILLLADGARQDVYRAFNPRTPVLTPAFEALARKGVLFRNAYANGSWTLPAVATILTGRYLARDLCNDRQTRGVPAAAPLLPELLRGQGFASAAFISNPWVSASLGFDRGWTLFRNTRTGMPLRADGEQLVADALAWIRAHREQRFFVYLHTFEPHQPFRACDEMPRYAGEYRGRLGRVFGTEDQRRYNALARVSDEDRRYVRALYYCEISNHDRLVGRLLRGLEELGLLETTLLVHTSDHGEELFDHGKVDHGGTVHEEVVRSPLAIRYPPLFPPGKVVDDIVEQVDLAPTILEALGLPGQAGLEGTSLRAALHGGFGLVPGYAVCEDIERGVRVGAFKLCYRETGAPELYDLSRDPGELRDVLDTHPVARRACEVYLGEGRAVPPKHLRLSGVVESARLAVEKGVLDEGLRKRLEALGYFNR